MNSFLRIVASLAFVFSPLCLADGTNIMNDEAMGHSPFEKLQHAFERGATARTSDFENYDGNGELLNVRYLTCLNPVGPDAKREQVTVADRIPFLAIGTIVAGHFGPGQGPLFPPKPERNLDRRGILWAGTGLRESREDMGSYLADNKVFLKDGDDEFCQTWGTTGLTESWRVYEGMLVQQQRTLKDDGQIDKVVAYLYCWSTPPAPQPQPLPQPQPVPVPQPVPQPIDVHRSGD